MIGGEIGVRIKNIILYDDVIIFEDADGLNFHVSNISQNNMAEKIRESLLKYELKSISEDIDSRVARKVDEILQAKFEKDYPIPW